MMVESLPTFHLPPPVNGQAFIEVSALEAGIIHLPLQFFVAGAEPSEIGISPSLSFLLRHSDSNKAPIIFDLGLRRDIENYPPNVRSLIAEWMPVSVPQSVTESLRKGSLDPQDVETIIISHIHFDHVGDAAPFSKANFIVGGECASLLETGYPSDPKSEFSISCFPADRTVFLATDYFNTSIGPFPLARDYFGDGSLYIVDAAGHLPGHINVLARTSPDGSWIYLAGDSAHDRRLISGEKEVAFSLDAAGHVECAHDNMDSAIKHIRRVGDLAKLPKVQVILSHDREWYQQNKGGAAFFPGKIPPCGA